MMGTQQINLKRSAVPGAQAMMSSVIGESKASPSCCVSAREA